MSAAADKVTPEDGWVLQRVAAVAWLRAIFALIAVLVIQLNPQRVARFPTLSSISLISFLFYSLVVLYVARQKKFGTAPLGVTTHVLDVLWIATIVFSTGGTRTPFFFYYSFPVITASIRWGLRGSIPVALAGVVLYGILRITLAGESLEGPIGIDTLLVRSLYLIVLAGIFGYICQFERNQNQRLLTLSQMAGEVAAFQERRRILFEIHDGILQSLATVILRLEGCRRRIGGTQTDLADEIRALEDLTRDSMKEIRLFLNGQVTKPLVPGTLVERLREQARFLRDGMGLDVILESEPEELNLPAPIEREIYYVLREALANVTRHSHASKTEIHLARRNGRLEGTLVDNGVGFQNDPLKHEKGFGLAGMEQRIKKLGGEFLLRSSPGAGTNISFSLPIVASGVSES